MFCTVRAISSQDGCRLPGTLPPAGERSPLAVARPPLPRAIGVEGVLVVEHHGLASLMLTVPVTCLADTASPEPSRSLR